MKVVLQEDVLAEVLRVVWVGGRIEVRETDCLAVAGT